MVEESAKVMNAEQARERARDLKKAGKTYAEIAEILMAAGYRGPQGGTKLSRSSVCMLIKYPPRSRKRRMKVSAKAAPRAATSRKPQSDAAVAKATMTIMGLELPLTTRVELLNVLVKHG